MKRTTHIMLGAAVGLSIAAPLSPALALGGVWWGMVGGGFPDWLDLRSDFRRGMRHRGLSHSVLLGALATIGFWLLLRLVTDAWPTVSVEPHTARLWTMAFAAGLLSHIAADACTHAGVRPLLPFSQVRWWLLPGFLRGRSDGHIDDLARLGALALLLFGLVRCLHLHGVI